MKPNSNSMQKGGRGVGQSASQQEKGEGEGVGETIGSYQRSKLVNIGFCI